MILATEELLVKCLIVLNVANALMTGLMCLKMLKVCLEFC